MYDLNKAYTQKFFDKRNTMTWRTPYVVQAIINVLQPGNVIDFGCGNGDLINEFLTQGVDSYGIEGTPNSLPAIKEMGIAIDGDDLLSPENRVIIRDLREPIGNFYDPNKPPPTSVATGKGFDLALCFEVAEHIEEKYVDAFINNLSYASDRVLITAAPPGQRGHHHVNCQTQGWWMGKFIKHGYRYGVDEVMRVRMQWKQTGKANKTGIKLYYKNLLYFYKG